MPYIGAGVQRFNTADNLTVSGTSELKNNVTVTGDVTASGTVLPTGDTAAGDAAALGFTSTEGLILTGQGSTSDVVIKNDADTTVCFVPTGTDDLKFNDTAAILMGTDSDMQIIHDGNNSIISDNGTGNLVLRSNAAAVEIDFNTDETAALFNHNGSVELYHDNAKKLETTSTGVDVTGIAVTDGLTSSAAIDVTTSTHANASVFKSTGNTQIMLQDTDASSNDQFWGFQVSGGDFNILTCNDDRASGFSTPFFITQAGLVTIAGTGIAIGGTGSANTLDDYEEGTFTPEIRIGGSTSGITNNSQVGQYTKIGRMVTLTGRVSISNKGSNSGAMTIAGMPFASQNTSNLESIGSVELQNMSSGTDNLSSLTNNNVHCRVSPNVLTIEMRRTMIGANDITNVQMTDTTVVSFTITYFT